MTDGKTVGVQAQSRLFGGPTKRFFVSMLTRDIELIDAILDLVDNCVDGAMRQSRGSLEDAVPFEKFRADLVVSEKEFRISDNCGGIPEDSIEDAFHLGRPNVEKDGDLPTIGMYGIGMKRAIFKIGNAAYVQSSSSDGVSIVKYSSDWLNPNNDDWFLPIQRGPAVGGEFGVTIGINDVKAEVGRDFGNLAFLNRLKGEISKHFGYIMQKGFSITVNGESVKPTTLSLISGDHGSGRLVRPFDYHSVVDDVSIRVSVGFFRGLVREEEIDRESQGAHEAETAGVSVVCNDRVIVLGDRSLRTGWGDGGVPRYHPQFRAIAGLIIISSTNADKLPISTTKRGLDAGSDVYLTARKATMEGLKIFTSFTNKWKGMEDDASEFFESKFRRDVRTEIALAQEHGKPVRGEPGSKKYTPDLPVPADKNPRRRVSFVRSEKDVKALSAYLFGEDDQHPSNVGGECFDRVLREVDQK